VSSRILPGAEPFRFDGGSKGALLLHGFTGSPASLHPLGESLFSRGLTVIGPRLPGHGTRWEDLEETTWQDWEREALGALADLSERCKDVIVVGLSVGGTLALHVGAKQPERLRGVIAINPLVRRPDFAFAPVIRVFTRTIRGIGNDIKKPGQDEVCYDRIPVKAIKELRKLMKTTDRELPSLTLPLLVLLSPQDHTVKPANSRRVVRRAGSVRKELITLPNSYHVATLDFDADTILEHTLRFMDSVPSNASSFD
jgi:carboxylesterase